jgi:hypothetical protein
MLLKSEIATTSMPKTKPRRNSTGFVSNLKAASKEAAFSGLGRMPG